MMSSTDHESDPPRREWDRPRLAANLTTTDDGRFQCTLHPPEPAEDGNTTRWLTALQDAFVDAESMR